MMTEGAHQSSQMFTGTALKTVSNINMYPLQFDLMKINQHDVSFCVKLFSAFGRWIGLKKNENKVLM